MIHRTYIKELGFDTMRDLHKFIIKTIESGDRIKAWTILKKFDDKQKGTLIKSIENIELSVNDEIEVIYFINSVSPGNTLADIFDKINNVKCSCGNELFILRKNVMVCKLRPINGKIEKVFIKECNTTEEIFTCRSCGNEDF